VSAADRWEPPRDPWDEPSTWDQSWEDDDWGSDDDALTRAALAAGVDGELHPDPDAPPADPEPHGTIWFGIGVCALLIGVVVAVPHLIDAPIRLDASDNGRVVNVKPGDEISVAMATGGWTFTAPEDGGPLREEGEGASPECAANLLACGRSSERVQVVTAGSTQLLATCSAPQCGDSKEGDRWSVTVLSLVR
jgi:hypothetical protein